MTKKDLEQENTRLRTWLEKIREIADNPQKYADEEFPYMLHTDGYAVGMGAIRALAEIALTGVIE